jgi:hypothetical protein
MRRPSSTRCGSRSTHGPGVSILEQTGEDQP